LKLETIMTHFKCELKVTKMNYLILAIILISKGIPWSTNTLKLSNKLK